MRTKRLKCAVLTACVAACLLMAVCLAAPTVRPSYADAGETTTAVYDFTDAAQLSDFTPVYAAEEGDGNGASEQLGKHFRHDAAAGKVTSLRDPASENAGQGSNNAKGWTHPAQLVLTKYTFTDFEAEIEMNYGADNATDGWGGLLFRKSSLLSGGRKGGCYAFVQAEGHATLWGDDPFTYTEGNKTDQMKEVKCTDTDFKSIYRYSPFLLTVRVVGKSCDVTVSSPDKATTYAALHVSYDSDASVRGGFVSLQSGDEYIDYRSLKITNLDRNGNPAPLAASERPTRIALDKSVTTYAAGEPVSLSATIEPTSAAKNVAWTVSDRDVAIVRDGFVYGLAAGEVTVTVSSAFDANVCDSITLTFTEPQNGNRYVFDTAASLENFTAAFTVESEGGDVVPASEHWRVQSGLLRRTGQPQNDNDASRHMAFLYLKDLVATDFAATLVYRYEGDEYGWIGITSGTMAYGKRCLDDGLGMFVQREGQPTVWGKNTDGPVEAQANGYVGSDWHVLHVKAYGSKAEVYLDDLSAPALTVHTDIAAGHVGFFTTCKANFAIRSFAFAYLDENGDASDIGAVQSIEIADKIATAKVGDSMPLTVKTTPAIASTLEYEYTVSDGSVAFVRDGVLRFISAGEVTVTAVCKFDKRLTDSFTVTVTADAPPTPPDDGDDKPAPDDGGDDAKDKKNGCGGAASAASAGMATMALLAGALAAAKRRVRKQGEHR